MVATTRIVPEAYRPKIFLSALRVRATFLVDGMVRGAWKIERKKKAATLATDLGFEPVDAGALAVARLLEPLAMLWITLAFKQGMGVDFGFRLARR